LENAVLFSTFFTSSSLLLHILIMSRILTSLAVAQVVACLLVVKQTHVPFTGSFSFFFF
jgi:hypothetical protein